MKTKEQVRKYLSKRYYDPDDWQRILEFCHERYGSGIHKALRPKLKSDWDGFVDWLENGIADGNVVRFDQGIGIVVDNVDGTYTIPVYDNGTMIFDSLTVTDISKATEKESDVFYSKLRKLGFGFSVSLSKTYKKPIPEPWSKVCIKDNGAMVLGVVKEYTETSAVMAFVIDGQLKHDVSYDLESVVIEKADKSCQDQIKTFLNSMSLHWNDIDKTLEPTIKRSKIGKPYWYITDKFGIARAIEKMTKISDIRYENHNYFSDYRDAVVFRNHIFDYRIEQIKAGATRTSA